MNKAFGFAPILIALLSMSVRAQDATTDSAVRIVREYIDYDLNDDGTGTVSAELALSPTVRSGINGLAQRTIDYQEGMSAIDLHEAYTLKANGKRIDVQPEGILTQVPAAYTNAAMFADMKVKRIVFPDVSVGDQVVYRYTRRILTPLFPGQHFDSRSFPQSMRHDDVRVTVRHARSRSLQFHVRDLQPQPDQATETHIKHEWRFANSQAIPEEPGAISSFDRDPVFEISSFKSWDDIAAAYDARAKDKAALTPEIQKTADRITARIRNKDKRKQAEVIYAWVVNNIRYVAIYLGAGGYVPHTAESILANRYGDCKDYVTLTEALLAAKGIASTPVIVNATNRFAIPGIPTPAAFNHAILYIPDFNVYLDPTARTLPFGILAPLEANKHVLHTRDFNELVQTPGIIAATNTLKGESTGSVGGDGSLTGTTVVSGVDLMAAQMRQVIGRLENPQAAKQFATALLSIEGLTGTANFTKQSAGNTAGYNATFAIDNWINIPGPGAVRLPTGLLTASPIRVVAMQTLNQPPFKTERVCIPGVFVETATIQLPDVSAPTNLPKDIEAANAVATYRAQYSRNGNEVKVSRTLEMNFPRTTCTPEESAQFREILEQARRDTSAQMTYE